VKTAEPEDGSAVFLIGGDGDFLRASAKKGQSKRQKSNIDAIISVKILAIKNCMDFWRLSYIFLRCSVPFLRPFAKSHRPPPWIITKKHKKTDNSEKISCFSPAHPL
jgi:hypothetical protein